LALRRAARSGVLLLLAMALIGCSGGVAATPRPSASPVTTAQPTGSPQRSAQPTRTPPPSPTPAATNTDAPGLQMVSDETGAISIGAPVGWSAESARWFHGDDDRGPALVVSEDPETFAAAFDGRAEADPEWGIEGVFVGVSTSLAQELELGDGYASAIFGLAKWHGGTEEAERGWNDVCLRGGASSYEAESGGASGFVTDWHDCGSVGTLLLDLGATGREGGYVAQAIAVMPQGDSALEHAWSILTSLSIDQARR
jgi:hypothetical protein